MVTPEALTGIDAMSSVRSAELGPTFAKQVVSLLASEAERDDLGRKARETALSNFGWGAQLSRFDARLRAVLRDHSSSSRSAAS